MVVFLALFVLVLKVAMLPDLLLRAEHPTNQEAGGVADMGSSAQQEESCSFLRRPFFRRSSCSSTSFYSFSWGS